MSKIVSDRYRNRRRRFRLRFNLIAGIFVWCVVLNLILSCAGGLMQFAILTTQRKHSKELLELKNTIPAFREAMWILMV